MRPPCKKCLQRSVLRRAPRAKLRLGWVVGNCARNYCHGSYNIKVGAFLDLITCQLSCHILLQVVAF
eukprot:scaffold33316_cov105-Skeletonema_dohrnii-CCMP3373.AAC.2